MNPGPFGARSAPVRLTAVALLAVPGLYLVNPNTTHVPLCPLRAMTGLWCPLCGATRAGYALLHGEFQTALHDNALFVLALPLLVVAWWRWLRAGSQPAAGRLLPRPALWALLALGLVFGVLRNLPAGSWLAPPA